MKQKRIISFVLTCVLLVCTLCMSMPSFAQEENSDELPTQEQTVSSEEKASEGTNVVREVDNDAFFYGEEAIFRDYLHGAMRLDEGTMEMTFNPVRPMSDMGNDWDFAMGVFTSQVTAGLSINIFAVYVPPKPDTGIIFLLKGKNGSYYLQIPDFDWQAGDKFNLACTWKEGDKVCMYKDGELVGSMEMGEGITEDILPWIFRVPKTTPFNVRKIKFSTKAKTAQELDLNVDTDFAIDEDTSFVTSDGLTSPTHHVTNWHKESGYDNITPVWVPSKQAFYEGEEILYPMVAINHSNEPKTYDIKFNIRDNNGIFIGSSKAQITVPPDGKYHAYEVALSNMDKPNYYNIHADIYKGEEKLFGYDNSVSVCIKNDTLENGEMADNFGLQISVDNDFDMMRTLGVSMSRAMNAFRWSRVEPVQGQFNFKETDIYADEMERLGYETMAVLGYPPKWAAQEPTEAERAAAVKMSYLPERWKPRSKEEWANYIYTTVSRYKGRIKYWEIYNEINFISPFSAQTFSGTKEEYYEFLRIAYAEAKRADPDCVVVLSGFSAPHVGAVDVDMPMEMIDDRFATGYYDIYNVHGYLDASSFEKEIAALKAKWPDKEYWMGEYMSFTLSGDVNRAVEFVKVMSNFAAAGYSKIVSMGVEGSDPVYNKNATYSPTASFQAMATMKSMLSKCDNSQGVVPSFNKDDTMRINHVFKRSDGKYISMLAAFPLEYTLTIANPDAEIYDMYGSKAEVEKIGTSSKVMMKDILYIVSDEPAKITSVVGTTSDNLLLNGKFEDCLGDTALGIEALEIDKWTINASGESKIVASEDKKSGRFAAQIYNSGKGKTYLSQKVDAFNPTQFKVTAKFKKTDSKAFVKPYVSIINNDTGKEVVRQYTKVGNNGYEEISEVLALPMKTKKGITFCFGALGSEGTVLVDDVQVTEVSEDTESTVSLVSNNGFEEGVTGWRMVKSADPGGVISTSTEARSGIQSMYFKSTGAGSVYSVQDITVNSPGTYKITAYCKRLSGRNVIPYFQIYDRNASKGTTLQITNLLSYKFVGNSATLNVENPNGTQLGIIFGIKTGEGEVLMDDIIVEKID